MSGHDDAERTFGVELSGILLSSPNRNEANAASLKFTS